MIGPFISVADTNMLWSVLICWRLSFLRKKLESLLYYSLRACFKPYSTFNNLHIMFLLVDVFKLFDNFYVHLINVKVVVGHNYKQYSKCHRFYDCSIGLIKVNPYCWRYPHTTHLALNYAILPLTLRFTLNTHSPHSDLCPAFSSLIKISSHILFFLSWSTSSWIAYANYCAYRQLMACSYISISLMFKYVVNTKLPKSIEFA